MYLQNIMNLEHLVILLSSMTLACSALRGRQQNIMNLEHPAILLSSMTLASLALHGRPPSGL